MNEDQAYTLRQQVAARPPERRFGQLRCLAVGSGKGGVGKTMVSVGLGYCLARRGRRVLIMDADLGLANVDLQIGVEPKFTLQDVIFGKCSLPDAVIAVADGPDILAAASGAQEMVDMGDARRRLFVEQLVKFAGGYDYLIIDVGAGIGQGVTTFLAAVPEALVVLANEPTSLMDAYALIKTLCRQPQPPLMMAVINSVRSVPEGQLLAQRLNTITTRFLGRELPVAGIIPHDHAVGDAIRARRSIVRFAPRSPVTGALESLTEFLVAGNAHLRAGAETRDARPLFDRLMGGGLNAGQGA